MLVSVGIAAREIGVSREALKQALDSGRLKAEVIRDSLGRRFLDSAEVERLRREREARRSAAR